MKQLAFELDSKFVGALPIVNDVLKRLHFSQLLQRHLSPPGPRAKMAPAQALEVLTRNLILARVPLYAIREWARQVAPDLLGLESDSAQDLGDDRLGRALDRLFDADWNAFLTEFVLHMIRVFSIDLEQFHNDSTSITLQGEYAEADGRRVRGKPTRLISHGFNPLVCAKCGGEMRIIAFITDYTVVDRIINHLKLVFVASKPPPLRAASQELLMAAEASAEYFS